MNSNAIQILFLKDLFLSRRQLFAYFLGGIASSFMVCVPNPTISFVGFILVLTAAIASGIHLIGVLLLSDSIDQTRVFVLSMPVSLLDYSISKISVILTTYLIPWSAMFALCVIGTYVLPWAKHGSVVILPAIFLYLLCGFTIQLMTAVISESIGWTISVMVVGNVLLNLFLMKLFALPEIIAAKSSDIVTWPASIIMLVWIEAIVIFGSIVIALFFQTRKRDLI